MVLSGISASYSSGTVTVTLTGTNAGQVYPVTISLVNGGTLVKLTTANVTGAATTTPATISAALSAGCLLYTSRCV